MMQYFYALQIVVLFVLHSNMYMPASVDVVINSVNGIITLSSLDKNKIASFLHLDSITNSKVFQSLDGLAIAGIGILIIIVVIGFLILISRKCPKLLLFFTKIKNIIFWNFLIRYFQASFIGMNYSAITVILASGGGMSEIASSVVILSLQYLIVCIIAQYLLRVDLIQLKTDSISSVM